MARKMRMTRAFLSMGAIALLGATTGSAAHANCDRNLANYNAIAGAHGAKLDEHDKLDEDPVRQCEVGREIISLLQKMKGAADTIRNCRIKGGVEPPSYYDSMITLGEMAFKMGCPGEGMDKCSQHSENLSDQIDALLEPFDEIYERNDAEELCAHSKSYVDAVDKADTAINAVKTKCSKYYDEGDDIFADLDGRLFELTEMQTSIHRAAAEDFKSRCK